jgi:hypothetical protein
MSQVDIEKGAQWSHEIDNALGATNVGILCITPDNLQSPWIHFEAGSLFKALRDKSRVCPYLFGVKEVDLTGPLTLFQFTPAKDQEETHKLIQTINRHLSRPILPERADEGFNRYWGDLKEKLTKIEQDRQRSGKATVTKKREPDEILGEVLSLMRHSSQNVTQLQEKLDLILPRLLHNYPEPPGTGTASADPYGLGHLPSGMSPYQQAAYGYRLPENDRPS